jgi:ribosomal protein S12
MGKPRGLRTARKHVKNRRAQVWADLDYKKAHLGTRWKANPFGGASHAKGIVLEKVSSTLIVKEQNDDICRQLGRSELRLLFFSVFGAETQVISLLFK